MQLSQDGTGAAELKRLGLRSYATLETPQGARHLLSEELEKARPKVPSSVFRICDANVQGLDVQEAHIRARSKSERAPMKTFMYVQNLELRVCTPLVPGNFFAPKNPKFWCTRHECRCTSKT